LANDDLSGKLQRAEGFIAPLTVYGAINGELFLTWVQQHLVPALRPGDIVVIDNLSSHKVAGVREAIEGAPAELCYLPPTHRISTRLS
jgi:transposase